jgi:hypothetical protein
VTADNHAKNRSEWLYRLNDIRIKYTLLARTRDCQAWTSYVWQGNNLVPNRDELRCRAIHPDSEMQCDFEVHEGDEHEFNNPVSWVACGHCGGGPEYHQPYGEVIAHEPGCPKLEESADDA